MGIGDLSAQKPYFGSILCGGNLWIMLDFAHFLIFLKIFLILRKMHLLFEYQCVTYI